MLLRRRRRTHPLPEFKIVEESFEPDLHPIPKSAQQIAVGEAQRAPLERTGNRRVTETTVALVASLAGVGYSTLVTSVKRVYQNMAGTQGTAPQFSKEEVGIELVWMPGIKNPKTTVGIGNIRKCRGIHKGLSVSVVGDEVLSSAIWDQGFREVCPNACEEDEESQDMKAIMRAKRPRSNSFPQTTLECESLSSYTKVLDGIGEAWIHSIHEKVIAYVEDDADVYERVVESDAKADTKVNLPGRDLDIRGLRINSNEPILLDIVGLETSEHDSGVDDSSEISVLGASYMSSSTFEFSSKNNTVHSPFATSRGVGSHIFDILERLRNSGADGEKGREKIYARPSLKKFESGATTRNHNAEEENSEMEHKSGWDIFEMSGDGHTWGNFERSEDWNPDADSEDGYMDSTFTDDQDIERESGLSSLGTSYQGC
jgi:hypothetical protein